MRHRLVIGLVVCASTFTVPRPAPASILSTTTFDTVDAVELNNDRSGEIGLAVTGILAGGSTPTTRTFFFRNTAVTDVGLALRCERFAVIAMSKPGKYKFAIAANGDVGGSLGACRLILSTP